MIVAKIRECSKTRMYAPYVILTDDENSDIVMSWECDSKADAHDWCNRLKCYDMWQAIYEAIEHDKTKDYKTLYDFKIQWLDEHFLRRLFPDCYWCACYVHTPLCPLKQGKPCDWHCCQQFYEIQDWWLHGKDTAYSKDDILKDVAYIRDSFIA